MLYNFWIDPFLKYYIFSSFKYNIKSQIHIEVFGGFFDFHFNNILLLANSEAKAKTFSILLVKDIPCSGTPKIAISTQGVIFKLKASFGVLNTSVQ